MQDFNQVVVEEGAVAITSNEACYVCGEIEGEKTPATVIGWMGAITKRVILCEECTEDHSPQCEEM